jgi:hypothetical protein
VVMADHPINSNKVTIRYRAVQSHETIFTIFTYWISNPKTLTEIYAVCLQISLETQSSYVDI